jgi:hypothetical protein
LADRPETKGTYPKTAACACGALTVSVTAPPQMVHLCTCLDCQRLSGSALTYTAFFAEAAATISGSIKPWRRIAGSSRWNTSHFCPECGSRVFTRMEALPGLVGIAVGCFADPAFDKPATVYWSTRRHHWLAPPAGLNVVETQ